MKINYLQYKYLFMYKKLNISKNEYQFHLIFIKELT